MTTRYAVLNYQDVPVELQPHLGFVTYHVKITTPEEVAGTLGAYEIGDYYPQEITHAPGSLLKYAEEGDLSRYRIIAVEEPEPPEGKAQTGYSLTYEDGLLALHPMYQDLNPVPRAISKTQGKLALLQRGLYPTVNGFIGSGQAGPAAEILWENEIWHRDSEMLISIALKFNMTDEDVDDLFHLASTL